MSLRKILVHGALLALAGGAFVPSVGLAQTAASSDAALPQAELVPAREPDLRLSGRISGEDHQTYLRAPFEVPPGTDRLVVAFDYDGREARTVIDLGLEDPHGFRGASGGNKSHFSISATDATPSYLAGPVDPGEWALSLAVPNIRAGVTAAWRAQVWFLQGAEAQMLPSPTAGRGPGWYRGDLHLHTGHSDGSCDSMADRRVPCPLFRTLEAAAASGLDFVAVTEHNTSTHSAALAEAQPYFDRMLLIPGREITTFYGHFNIFGISSAIDFRIAPGTGVSFNAIADEVHRLGGIVSINHPGLPSGEICMGCGWTMDRATFAPPVDYAKADAVEVVNGSGTAAADNNAEGLVSGIPFWADRLGEGIALAPLGGSDNHDPDRDGLGRVGAPVTVIEAADLTPAALFEGIRRGRTFVVVDPALGVVELDFTVRAADQSARMGGSLALASAGKVAVTPAIVAPPGSTVEIRSGAVTLARMPIADANAETVLELAPGLHAIHLRVRSAAGALLAIGNAVHISVGPGERQHGPLTPN